MAQFLIGIKERKGYTAGARRRLSVVHRTNCSALSFPFRWRKSKPESTGKASFATQGGTAFRSWLQAAGLQCGIRTVNLSLGWKSTRTYPPASVPKKPLAASVVEF